MLFRSLHLVLGIFHAWKSVSLSTSVLAAVLFVAFVGAIPTAWAQTGVTLSPITRVNDYGSYHVVKFEWTRSPISNFSSYKIYRSTSPNVTTADTLAYTITGGTGGYNSSGQYVYGQNVTRIDLGLTATAAPGTNYYFKIFVEDTAGQNIGSNEETYLALNAAPEAVTLNAVQETYDYGNQKQLKLTWSKSAESDFSAYKIYRSTSPNVTTSDALVTTINSYSSGSDAQGNYAYGVNVNATQFSVPATIPPGTTHYFKVFVEDSAAQRAASNEESFNATNSAPAAVTLNPVEQIYDYGNQKQIRLTWSKSSERDFEAYKIYRRTTTGVTVSDTLVTTITSNSGGSDSQGNYAYGSNVNSTQFTVPATAPPGTTHYFRVFVEDSAAQQAGSNEQSFNATNSIPAAVTLNPITQTYDYGNQKQIRLTWSKSAEADFEAYKIYRSTSPDVTTNDELAYTVTKYDGGSDAQGNYAYGANVTSAQLNVSATAPPGTTYYFKVFVEDSATQRVESNEQSFNATNSVPSAVVLNAVEQTYDYGNQKQLKLTWSKSAESDFEAYKIYQSTSPNVTTNDTLARTITKYDGGSDAQGNYAYGANVNSVQFNVSATVPPGTTYYFKVFVEDSAAQQAASNEQSFNATNAGPVAVVLNPIAQTYDYGNQKQIRLTWSKSGENDFEAYKIYYSTSPNVTTSGTLAYTITKYDGGSDAQGNYAYGANANATQLTLPASTPPGTTYYFKVIVEDSAGQQAVSNEESFLALNDAPSAVTLNPIQRQSQQGTTVYLRLTWSKSSERDFAAYKIYRSTSPNVTTADNLEYTITQNSGGSDSEGNYTYGANVNQASVQVELGAAPGTTYYFKVFVEDSAGQQAASNEESYLALNEAPSAVTLNPVQHISNNGSTNNVRLTWTKSAESDFAAYKIYRSTSPVVTTSDTLVTTITSSEGGTDASGNYAYGINVNRADVSVPGSPDPGTTYYFRVFVFDSLNQVAGSNVEDYVSIAVPNLKRSYQFNGKGNWSLDAVGSNQTPVGVIEAFVPLGSRVEKAFLYSTMYAGTIGSVTFDGVTYNSTQWTPLGYNLYLQALRCDVTEQVRQKIGSGSSSKFEFTINSEDPNWGIDGEVLAIVYSNPGEEERTIAFLDGFSSSSGDSTLINLSEPLENVEAPGFEALLSLGIGFGYQPSGQYSEVDVNGRRLTTSAGGQDDGESYDGALVTVGGLGDSTQNPIDPFVTDGAGPRTDDELYDLAQGNGVNPAPFLVEGAKAIHIETKNPSNNDNIFFVGINITARAGVNQAPPEPGTR